MWHWQGGINSLCELWLCTEIYCKFWQVDVKVMIDKGVCMNGEVNVRLEVKNLMLYVLWKSFFIW